MKSFLSGDIKLQDLIRNKKTFLSSNCESLLEFISCGHMPSYFFNILQIVANLDLSIGILKENQYLVFRYCKSNIQNIVSNNIKIPLHEGKYMSRFTSN